MSLDPQKALEHQGKCTYPVQLSIMRQNHIRRTKCEICTQTRPLDSVEVVEEGNGIGLCVKCGGEKAAVAAVGVAAFFVVGAGAASFGVVHLFDCGIV